MNLITIAPFAPSSIIGGEVKIMTATLWVIRFTREAEASALRVNKAIAKAQRAAAFGITKARNLEYVPEHWIEKAAHHARKSAHYAFMAYPDLRS